MYSDDKMPFQEAVDRYNNRTNTEILQERLQVFHALKNKIPAADGLIPWTPKMYYRNHLPCKQSDMYLKYFQICIQGREVD